jgi:predicted dehydrogenase
MWRRDQTAAQENCREHGIAHCFASAEALCISEDVDVVFVTSPDAMHRNDALLALRHGKAVLCEKPLSMRASEAEEMVAAAEAAGLLFGSAQNYRYNHTLDWLREQILAGRIGVPQLARCEFAYPAHTAPRTWINDLNLACGGPIGDVGVHCIDSLRYVLDQDVVSVSTLAVANAPGSRVEAYASLQLAMTGGTFATVTVSARAPYRTLIEVTGSDGVLIAENGLTVDRPVEVELRRAGERVETKILDNGDGYIRMIDDFARVYRSERGEGEFRATGPGGLHNMRALDAAYTSWRTGLREPL